jgi:hypothetical protein
MIVSESFVIADWSDPAAAQVARSPGSTSTAQTTRRGSCWRDRSGFGSETSSARSSHHDSELLA